MFRSKYNTMLSVIIVLLLSYNSGESIDYDCEGGEKMAQTGGEELIGYKTVVNQYKGDPPVISGVRCRGGGTLHCAPLMIDYDDSDEYDLEIDLSTHLQEQLADSVFVGYYNENHIVGSTTYYGSISWSTDSTGRTIANSMIIVSP